MTDQVEREILAAHYWGKIKECIDEGDFPGAITYALTAGTAGKDLADIVRSSAIDSDYPPLDLGFAPTGDGSLLPKEPPRVLSMAELQMIPPPTWLVQDIIPDRGLGILVGDGGSGKSLFALELANAVARGRPLFGSREVVRPGWVLVLLAESIASWSARSAAYNAYHGLEPTDEFGAIIDGVNFSTPKGIADLSLVVRQEINVRGSYPALIILDTVSAAIPGVDENSQAAVTPLLAELNRWVRYGIAVIALHHPSKAGAAYRGSSAFRNNIDWMVNIVVSGNRREVIPDKERDMKVEKPLAFEIIKHGASIVPVECAGASPTFMAFSEPGLMDALRDHAYYLEGSDTRRPVRGISFATGVTVGDLMKTWGDTMPVPIGDKQAYDGEYARRKRVLVRLLSDLIKSGSMTCEGKLTSRDYNYPVRQVLDRE